MSNPVTITAEQVRAALAARGLAADAAPVEGIVRAVSRLDRIAAQLKSQCDALLAQGRGTDGVLSAQEDEALHRVIGRSVEVVDAMLLMREAILHAVVAVHDADVQALLGLAEAVSGRLGEAEHGSTT